MTTQNKKLLVKLINEAVEAGELLVFNEATKSLDAVRYTTACMNGKGVQITYDPTDDGELKPSERGATNLHFK